jgi:retron-type reverse transcriptase
LTAWTIEVSTTWLGGGLIIGEIFHRIISLPNLLHAWKEFKRGKNKNREVASFSLYLEDNLFKLHNDLMAGTYIHDPYADFYICDPKRRHIHKASVRDRVLHQAVFQVLYPLFDKHFIFDSYSSRNNKGTHLGVVRLACAGRKITKNWRQPAYALKCDVRKFFDSIDHEILRKLITKKVHEKEILDFIHVLLGTFEKSPGKGLPLGNVTSQLFANVYMDRFDQYAKHVLKAKYYFRYCDDFIILDKNKKELEELIPRIENFLLRVLALQIHPDKISIRKFRQGIDFLGYVILPQTSIIRTKTKNRILKKIEGAMRDFKNGTISKNTMLGILDSYLGVLSHCRARKIREKILDMKSTL